MTRAVGLNITPRLVAVSMQMLDRKPEDELVATIGEEAGEYEA